MRQAARIPRPQIATVVLVALTMACGPFTAPGQPQTARMTPKLAVPAYFYHPLSAYQQLAQNVPAVGLVVVNVDSGPGTVASPEWASAIEAAHRAGVLVVVYVDTGYIGTTGHRTRPPASSTSITDWASQVRNDIDTWYRFYGASLDGVFFDQSPALCGPRTSDHSWVDFYVDASRYVKGRHPGARVVANPGQVPDECYTRAADTLVTFEGPYATYIDPDRGPCTPRWARKASPEQTWHLVYQASAADMTDVIARARAANAGYVYATNLTLPNPWAGLPVDEYWNEELVRVGGSPDTTPPTAPRRLRAREVYFNRVSLAWDSSRDDVAVAGYYVYQGATLIISVHTTQAAVVGLAPGTPYTFTVRARDPAGNVSPASAPLKVTTPAAG